MNTKLLLLFIISVLFKTSLAQSGCPQVFTSANQTLNCNQTCTDITASVFDVGETTSYSVNSIPYAPPIAYNAAGGTAVSVNVDDVWSNVITLPFPFCFFGQTYTTCKIGSNGAIQLGSTSSGGYHPWPFSNSCPSPNLVQAGNIFGPYHDIDPSISGTVKYHLQGVAPCRTLIVSYHNLAHFDCNNLKSTFMMVLYETTNIIEVYINNKPVCNDWNSGRAVVGIQDATGTNGYTPSGRNTGNWSVNTPEAWQFKPSGNPIYSPIEWFEGTTLIGTGNTLNVCPTNPISTYTAKTTYTRCDGLQIETEDQIVVDFTPPPTVSIAPSNLFSCSGQSVALTAQTTTAVSYLWTPGGQTTQTINVSPTNTTTYDVIVTDITTGCTNTASTDINIAQPSGTACNVFYVSTTGTPTGDGTKVNPLDLITAINLGACNGTTIKMAQGTYTFDSTITDITNYLTLEGGFDPITWAKSSTAGATTIFRSAQNITDETGNAPRLVAIEIFGMSGFRLQDITIEVANAPVATGTNKGVSTYGLYLNNCSDYNIVRTQIIAGNGGMGANGISQSGTGGANNGANGGNGTSQNVGCGGSVATGGSGSSTATGNGGSGGAGFNGDGCNFFGCNGNAINGNNGGNGTNGTNGTSFVPGNRPPTPTVTTSYFEPGGLSSNGTNGDGGGGGGGGSGGSIGTCCVSSCGSGNAFGGDGGNGGNGGLAGGGAFGGGASYAVFILTNGANTNFIDCNLSSGTLGLGGDGGNGQLGTNGTPGQNGGFHSRGNTSGGDGGNGGNGGNGGRGQDGSNGESVILKFISGTAIATQNISFNLVAQPVISIDDVSCTATNINFASVASDSWSFDLGSNPSTATGNNVITQYSTLGRKNIGFGTDNYVGFANILLDDQIAPAFSTTAQMVQGQYRICTGETVSFTATNGNSSYVYDWDLGSNALPQNTYFGLGFETVSANYNIAGVYTISLNYETNCCGQSIDTSILLYVEETPTIVMPADQDLCFGNTSGVALNVVGSANTNITWSPNTGLSSINTYNTVALPTATTSYVISVTDSTGLCSVQDSVTVNIIDLLLTTSATASNCTTLGTATVSVANGSGSYSYIWSNGEITQSISNLQAGTYTVIVTDNNSNCIKTATVIVPAGVGALVATTISSDILCFGDSNGQIIVNVSGGTAPYTYNWNPNGVTTGPTNNSSDTLSSLAEGIYTIDITDSQACLYTIIDTVESATEIVFVEDSIFNPTCVGLDSGYIRITPDGGERPYSFSWSNGMPVVVVNDDVIATNLAVGNYVLYLTDANGCQDSISITLTGVLLGSILLDTICSGDNYTLPSGNTLSPTSSAIIEDTLTSVIGCDSVITINLTVNPRVSDTIEVVICEGETYQMPNDSIRTEAGEYTFSYLSALDCDSIFVVNLIVNPVYDVLQNRFICHGETYTLPDGNDIDESGTYFSDLTTTEGCDSVIKTNLVVFETFTTTIDTVMSENTPTYTLPDGSIVSVEGTYENLLTSVNGCDSMVITNIRKIADWGIPNAFSPNGTQEANRVFTIVNQYNLVELTQLQIFNRWGQKVFDDKESNINYWDGYYKGKLQSAGNYTYILKVKNLQGKESDFYSGNFLLIW